MVNWTDNYTTLQNTLASMYLDTASAQRIAVEAGIDPRLVKFSDSAVNNWHLIIREADAQGVLIPLVERAIDEHKTNETLKDLLNALKAQPKIVKPIKPPLISDLQLRDFIYEHLDKKDIGNVLFQVTEALRQANRIPDNTNIEIDTFSSMGEPLGTILIEMIKYFHKRNWMPFLIATVRDERQDAFREKFER